MSTYDDIIRCLQQLAAIRKRWGLPPLETPKLKRKCPICKRQKIFIYDVCEECEREYYDE